MAFWSGVCGLVTLVALLAQHAAKPGAAAPLNAVGGVEVTDAAGDIEPIVYRESVGDGPEKEVKYPGFDVVKLAVTSDGTTLSFAATLKAPPVSAAFDVLEFYVDADNRPAGPGVGSLRGHGSEVGTDDSSGRARSVRSQDGRLFSGHRPDTEVTSLPGGTAKGDHGGHA
jgi:hypothetical protein